MCFPTETSVGETLEENIEVRKAPNYVHLILIQDSDYPVYQLRYSRNSSSPQCWLDVEFKASITVGDMDSHLSNNNQVLCVAAVWIVYIYI